MQVLNLAGNPNGSLDQGLATVLVYASHNTAPSNQVLFLDFKSLQL